MDIFAKCFEPTIADEIREKGIYPYFHALESRQATEVIMESKRRIMLGSNNYLGLTSHPEVIEAGIRAYEEYGSGCSGSRFLNGTLNLHLQLEEELAEFLLPLRDAGVDIFHCTGEHFAKPEYDGSGLNLAGWVRIITGKPVISTGEEATHNRANLQNLYRMLRSNEIDMVSLMGELQDDPHWAHNLRQGNTPAG